jgi:hypothetical protein
LKNELNNLAEYQRKDPKLSKVSRVSGRTYEISRKIHVEGKPVVSER